ncbi:exonuclease [Microbacterium phage Fork]|nr:exonuclease [Microbacterium phage Lyell]AXC36299.1 exonuclease [Microbacterium phage Fork]QWS69441.1 DnaQ-like DNA polymerase III subunit [Microbacterium phage Necrophoxinus]URM87480.1 DnaQ-like DNA polymerase III subunit [Microbacterium phage DustyDino]UVK62491.1 exonuclease [Microbacterium phage Yuma]WMI33948.1 exonuclease [Microbacterium phage Erenyeager]WNO25968.1 DnaQ-like DNA polymerase III subunit [Microbacterium phage ASegato]
MKREDAPERICTWDTETTGVDIANDRIITAYARIRNRSGETEKELSVVIDPGVPIPQGASDVHGMTDEWVQEHGGSPRKGINDIYMFLSDAVRAGIPIVGYNNSFDLGILSYEVQRHFRFDMWNTIGTKGVFFDPIVYDRAMDQYRKGKRTLEKVAPVYGVPFDPELAHDAKYDVEVTCKLAWRIFQRSPYTLEQLQAWQPIWKKEWADHITEYFESIGKTNDDGSKIVVSGAFPWEREGDTK